MSFIEIIGLIGAIASVVGAFIALRQSRCKND